MKKNLINNCIYAILTNNNTTHPDSVNLIKCAGQQLQRAAAYAVLEQQRNALRKDFDLPKHSRARIAQAAAKAAGRFMMVLPGTALRYLSRDEVLLQDHVWQDNVEIRLGCGLARRLHEGTTCGCGMTPDQCGNSQQFFDHVLGCASGTNGAVYDQHQLLQPVFKPFFEKLGYKWDVADSSLQFSVALHSVAMAEVEGGEPQDPGKKKLDAVAHCREDSRKTLDIDFSCVHAASKSYCVTEKACSVADSPTFATRQAEGGKLKKYGHLCAVRGHILLPIVLNTYGGFGDEIMKIVDKHFDAKRAEEKAATGQEWVTLAERELLFQRAGVAVARGNSAILDTLRHTWSKGGTKRRQAKDPNKLWAGDFLAELDMFSAAEIAKVVRSGGF
jgi:hypothetical protein